MPPCDHQENESRLGNVQAWPSMEYIGQPVRPKAATDRPGCCVGMPSVIGILGHNAGSTLRALRRVWLGLVRGFLFENSAYRGLTNMDASASKCLGDLHFAKRWAKQFDLLRGMTHEVGKRLTRDFVVNNESSSAQLFQDLILASDTKNRRAVSALFQPHIARNCKMAVRSAAGYCGHCCGLMHAIREPRILNSSRSMAISVSKRWTWASAALPFRMRCSPPANIATRTSPVTLSTACIFESAEITATRYRLTTVFRAHLCRSSCFTGRERNLLRTRPSRCGASSALPHSVYDQF